MAKLIMYLLESSALLAFFYLLYVLVLRKETFFSLNRFFLLGILAFSLLFPLISFDFSPTEVTALERPIAEISKARMSYYEAMAAWEFEARSAVGSTQTVAEPGVTAGAGVDWLRLVIDGILLLYAIGAVICLSRSFWTLRWIWKVISSHPHEELDGIKVVKLPQSISPFSFLNYVFVPDSLVDSSEFQQILANEKTHIEQRHSVDLLIVQLLAAFLWFNPVIWQLIKSLKTTHEYIADEKIITSGYSLVEYQTLLLKQLISNNSFGLVHNFNLSFIKKRITMMTNQKSGWSGKVRVAMTLVGAIVFSVIVVQCNSKMDEQVATDSGLTAETSADFTTEVNLPVLFDNGYIFDGNRSDVLNFTIADNKLSIDGKAYTVSDIASVLSGAKLSDHGAIIMRVDEDQPMEFVRDVQMELRKADRRKIVYMGQTVSGKSFEMTLLLPPVSGRPRADGKFLPEIDDRYAEEHDIDILEIHLGDNAGAANQQLVYDFVTSQIQKGKSNYVVSAKCNDDDTYSDYMVNLAYIQGGFDQIYQERSQQMFGKDFYDLEYGKNEYTSVRQGIPKAISVAEN